MKGENSVSGPEQGKNSHRHTGKAGHGMLESMQGEEDVYQIVIQRENE